MARINNTISFYVPNISQYDPQSFFVEHLSTVLLIQILSNLQWDFHSNYFNGVIVW